MHITTFLRNLKTTGKRKQDITQVRDLFEDIRAAIWKLTHDVPNNRTGFDIGRLIRQSAPVTVVGHCWTERNPRRTKPRKPRS